MKVNFSQIVARYRGVDDLRIYENFRLLDKSILAKSANEIMSVVPSSFGSCALISSMWTGYLRDKCHIPAVVVAGDLKVKGKRIFRCKKNLPQGGKSGQIYTGKWDGHCWIEVDGVIGDLSLFRTAYLLPEPSILKKYVVENFGYGKGALICPKDELPVGIQYEAKYVLNDGQISCLIAGMSYQLEHENVLPRSI